MEITSESAMLQNINLQKIANKNSLDMIESRFRTANNAVDTAQASLDLKLSGASEEQIAIQEVVIDQANATLMMQEALLKQAQAAYDSLLINLEKYKLVAAFDGVVTEQLAKKGELASPQLTLLSLMADNSFQLESSIRETDIDKLKIGNKVSIEFDALAGETFSGEVIFINPANYALKFFRK